MKLIKKIINDTIRFFPDSIEEYRKIQNYFVTSKLEFYGLTLKSERPRKIIIKGIPKDTRIDEIKAGRIKRDFSIHSWLT